MADNNEKKELVGATEIVSSFVQSLQAPAFANAPARAALPIAPTQKKKKLPLTTMRSSHTTTGERTLVSRGAHSTSI